MKYKMNLEEFRKKFEDLFPGFNLRIRKDSDDLAYYNGIKAFTVKTDSENEDYINFSFPLNVYTCNYTMFNNEINENKNYEELKKNLINITKGYEKYFNFSMSEITFQGASEYDFNEVNQRFEDFQKNIGITLNLTNDKEKFIISFSEVTDIDTIYDIQFKFFEYMKKPHFNLISVKDCFNYNASPKNEECEDITAFRENIIKAINSYNGKGLPEKKYQHLFLLNASEKSNLLKGTYPFEEEYEISKYRSKDNGRIDCIFYRLNDKKITDVYLVELKVDEEVIDGNNGVLSHLVDIKYNVNDKKRKQKFFGQLRNRIEYRLQQTKYDNNFSLSNNLYTDNEDNKDSNYEVDFNIYFYTIIGIRDNHENEVFRKLKALNNHETVQKILNKEIDYKKGEKRMSLNENLRDIKNLSIENLVNEIDGITCKFFYDNWDGTMEITDFQFKRVEDLIK